MRGRISKWSGSYGFIRYGGQDIYIHMRNFVSGSHPELNAIVEFELGPPHREDRPPQAINVRTAKRAAEVLAEFRQHNAGVQALLNGNQCGVL